MSLIQIQRQHHMPRQQVKEQVGNLAETLKEKLQGDYHWDDDILTFTCLGASGQILVDDEQVDVRIELSFLLMALHATVEQSVTDYLDEHII